MHYTDRRRTAVGTVVLVASIAGFGDHVGACRCMELPVCYATGDSVFRPAADVIFVGRVIESKNSLTHFRVERVVVGDQAAELTLYGSGFGCDMTFSTGERYLVYAYRSPATGTLGTSFCSRTRLMSDPRADADLAYFAARQAGSPTRGWLSGVVEERHYDHSRGPDGRVRQWVVRPLARIPITVSSPTGESYSTVTDASGRYVFTGLPPIDWRLLAKLPPPLRPHDGRVGSRTFGPTPTVRWGKDASCAEADVDARVDGVITGLLLDESGRPGRGIVVQLGNISALDSDPYALRDAEVMTDEHGRFEFRPVPAGRYVVGVQLARPHMTDTLDRRRYHPGVRQRSAATVIALDRGQRLQLDPFRLPPLPSERTIRIVVRAPSPEVAAATSVFLVGATKEPLDLIDGSAALRLSHGAEYRVHVLPPKGHTFQFERSDDRYRKGREGVIGRDDTDRTIEIHVRPQ